MLKDIVISILAAVILSDVSWLSYERSEKWIIIMGLTIRSHQYTDASCGFNVA